MTIEVKEGKNGNIQLIGTRQEFKRLSNTLFLLTIPALKKDSPADKKKDGDDN